MIFLGLILSVFYLSSCGAILIKPKGPIEDVNYRVTDRINSEKTVEITAQGKNNFLHWIFETSSSEVELFSSGFLLDS